MQCWTLHRQPKRQDTKPFLRAIGDRLTKVALKQMQHENQSEARIKAKRKWDLRNSSFSGTLGIRGKNKNRVLMAPTQRQTAGEVHAAQTKGKDSKCAFFQKLGRFCEPTHISITNAELSRLRAAASPGASGP